VKGAASYSNKQFKITIVTMRRSQTQFIYIILTSCKLQFIVESIVKYFDAKFARIWLIDREKKYLMFWAIYCLGNSWTHRPSTCSFTFLGTTPPRNVLESHSLYVKFISDLQVPIPRSWFGYVVLTRKVWDLTPLDDL
jgi:hypothetical protein